MSRVLTISLFAAEYCPLICVNAEPSPGLLLSSSCMLIHEEDCVLKESLIPLAEDSRDIVFLRMTAGNHIQTGTGPRGPTWLSVYYGGTYG